MSLMSVSFKMKYEKLEKLYNGEIPQHIIDRISFFKQLDVEYKSNSTRKDNKILFSPSYINKSWRGLWLKATGIDEYLYLSYLIFKKEHGGSAVSDFKESHPKEKHVPYCIEVVDEDMI